MLKLDKQFPVEQFEATVSQSTVPSPLLGPPVRHERRGDARPGAFHLRPRRRALPLLPRLRRDSRQHHAGDRRWTRSPRPQPKNIQQTGVSDVTQLILHLSKPVICGSSRGRGLQFHLGQVTDEWSRMAWRELWDPIMLIIMLILIIILMQITLIIVMLTLIIVVMMIIQGPDHADRAGGLPRLLVPGPHLGPCVSHQSGPLPAAGALRRRGRLPGHRGRHPEPGAGVRGVRGVRHGDAFWPSIRRRRRRPAGCAGHSIILIV